MYKFELRIQKHTKHKECLAPALETSKTADMKKSDIPITQIGDKVKVVGKDHDFNRTFKVILVHQYVAFQQYCHTKFYHWSSSSR